MGDFEDLLTEARACRLCEATLPLGPRPVFQVSPAARLLIAGHAPGRRVHASGVPFQDASGVRLREWLGIDEAVFRDARRVAILPMGFCHPGTGRGGDLPPRPECAATWRSRLLAGMGEIRLTVVIGAFAMAWHLGTASGVCVTETVRSWQALGPGLFPLPHPSPRNNFWLRRNPWFESDVLPELRARVAEAIAPDRRRDG